MQPEPQVGAFLVIAVVVFEEEVLHKRNHRQRAHGENKQHRVIAKGIEHRGHDDGAHSPHHNPVLALHKPRYGMRGLARRVFTTGRNTGDLQVFLVLLGHDVHCIVNGDDALSAYLAMDCGNPFVTYGISKPVIKNKTNEIREGRFCKCCGERLVYSFYHYSQLGDYRCPKCGFKRPEINFDATDVKVDDQIAFTVEDKRIVANYKGFYNVYNILAAYAAGRTGGLGLEHFQDMLTDFNPENGRMEQFEVKGTKIVLNLAKNPAGFNQNISAVMQDDSMKDVIIVINDNAQDGTDVSWLWDVDFDRFKGANVNSITVSGIRCQDMRLRMKYVDIPSMLEADVEKAIRERVEDGCGNLYVLVNYTALFSTRNVLKKMEEER